MAKFRKEKKAGSQQLNTASLPDIVFMLLFFFMVSTSMKEVELMVKIKAPKATAISKLEKKSLVSYIFVGVPMNTRKYGSEPRIQLNDSYSTVDDIQSYILQERESGQPGPGAARGIRPMPPGRPEQCSGDRSPRPLRQSR